MASKKTVTLHNLEALGGERLAEILVDLAEVSVHGGGGVSEQSAV